MVVAGGVKAGAEKTPVPRQAPDPASTSSGMECSGGRRIAGAGR